MQLPALRSLRRDAFTIMEILVVVAIILVLAAIAVPAYTAYVSNANKGVALRMLKDLASSAQTFISDNNGDLPLEDATGTDSWAAAADPANAKAWYNALPKIMGRRTVADYAITPRAFYTKENVLYLPGATYPESDRKLVKPLFAIGINNKLQRKDADGKKPAVKLAQIANAARTPLFLEQGLPSEKKSSPVQSNRDFDGAPKASAKSFPGRYGGKGVIAFVDGHVEEHDPKTLLTESGAYWFPPNDIIWCRTPDEDPNR